MHGITASGLEHCRTPRPRSADIRLVAVALLLAVFGAPSRVRAQDNAAQESVARASAGGDKKAEPPSKPAPPDASHMRRPWFGGLGYLSIAPFFGELSSPKAGLQAPEVLGASYGVGKASLLLGGGGGAVLFGHLWLGIKGYGLLTAPFHNARGEAMLTGAGGAFELGYVLAAHRKMLIIPFLGVGGFAYRLEVTNGTPQSMTILQAVTLAPDESKDFTASFATLDVGIRVQRLLFVESGGFSAGFEFGLLRSMSTSPWRVAPYQFTHERGAILDGAYLRVNIGGGGFSFR
jgi:hypothetical protein